MKLTIKDGSPVEVESGEVAISGQTVILYDNAPTSDVVIAYVMNPGEKVRRVAEGEYVVEY